MSRIRLSIPQRLHGRTTSSAIPAHGSPTCCCKASVSARSCFRFLLFGLAWKWVRSDELQAGAIKLSGTMLLLLSLTAAVSFSPKLTLFSGAIPIGGLLGMLLAQYLMHALNPTGAILLTITTLIVSVYLVSTFTVSKLASGSRDLFRFFNTLADAWRLWRDERRQRKAEKARLHAAEKSPRSGSVRNPRRAWKPRAWHRPQRRWIRTPRQPRSPWRPRNPPISLSALWKNRPPAQPDSPPWEVSVPVAAPVHAAGPMSLPAAFHRSAERGTGRSPYDEQELKDIAVAHQIEVRRVQRAGECGADQSRSGGDDFRIQTRSRHQIQPHHHAHRGFVPGLAGGIDSDRAHSGQADGGIEVPNTQARSDRLRQMLESEEFAQSQSRLTISLGKDINGRIKVAALESMPHLLIAGSTGSGKSVMINSHDHVDPVQIDAG